MIQVVQLGDDTPEQMKLVYQYASLSTTNHWKTTLLLYGFVILVNRLECQLMNCD